MKKVDTSFISTTAGLPAKAGVLNHLQEAHQETALAIGQALIGPEYDPAKIYVLYGCVNSGSGLSYIITAGAVFFNGEIYLVDAVSFVASAGQVAVGQLATTYATSAIGDPIQFTDGSSHNVLQIRKMVIAAAATAGNNDFTAWLRVNQLKTENRLIAAFGSGIQVNFRQDQSLFFTTGHTTGVATIGWDFNGAIPGTVVRLKVVMGSGTTLNIDTPAGSQIINETGTSTTANKTNIIWCCYVGKNDGGNHEVSYKVILL